MKKVALIILDGWGHGKENKSNAEKSPTMSRKSSAKSRTESSERPTEKDELEEQDKMK